MRKEAMNLLQQEADLKEIARLVGTDALSDNDRLILETTKSIREDFLHQNAFDPVDTYTSFDKQYSMLRIILDQHHKCLEALEKGVDLDDIIALPIQEEIGRMRDVPEDQLDKFDELTQKMINQIEGLYQEP